MKKIITAGAFALFALFGAPMASADGYLDTGSYDETMNILDEDGTHGEWDEDGAHPGEWR